MELQGIVAVQAGDEDRIKALADMGGESFMEEMMTIELLSVLPEDRAIRMDVSRKIICSNLRSAAPYGGTYGTEDDSALAIAYLKSEIGSTKWSDVEDESDKAAINSIDDAEMRDALTAQLEKMAPIANFDWQDEFAAPTSENPSGDFIHFTFLAVDKNKRGSGAFRRLVEPYFHYADQHRIPCFLETYSDKLVQLYGHFGFETVKEFRSPEFQIYERCMMRRPQA